MYEHTHTYTHTHTTANSLAAARRSHLSRNCEPASKAPGTGLGHPKSHLDHCCSMRKGLEFAPLANARYPITAGWTGEAGRRQMENQMEKLLEWGLNLGEGAEPRTQPLHHTATHRYNTYLSHTHTHTHTHVHTVIHLPHIHSTTNSHTRGSPGQVQYSSDYERISTEDIVVLLKRNGTRGGIKKASTCFGR